MTEWMKTILSLSLSGSAVIAATGLLCLLVRGRAGWRWRYYVWLIAAARLLLPFSPAGSPAEELTVRAERRAVQAVEAVEISAPETKAASTPETPPGLRELGALALENLWAVWLAGALALGVRKVTAYRSFKRYLRAGWMAVEDPAALDLAAEAGALAGVRRPVEVYVNPLTAVPVLVGTVRPVVVLPSAEPGEDLFCVLLHELTHCRRGDILYKGLVQLTVCVHWFNPLVHWMARETERACELSCDEAVLGLLDESGRRAYGDALLRSVEAGDGYRADASAAALGKAGKLLKERLDAIMNYKKVKRSAAALSLALAVLVGLTAAAAGAYTGAPAPSPLRTEAEEAEAHRYTMDAYREGDYLFGIGWNTQKKTGASAAVTLPEGGQMKVWFEDTAKELRKDKEAMKALGKLLSRLREAAEDTDFPLERPLVYRWEKTGGSSPEDLAEKYYEAGDLSFFKTAFAMLGEPGQTAWMARIYRDGDMAFFSVAADGLEAEGDIAKAFAERAYADGAVSCFAVLADRMSEETLEVWLARAEKDGRTGFRAVVLDHLEDWDDDWDWDDDDWDWDWDWDDEKWAEQEKRLAEEYAAHGVTMDGKKYYYRGELVNVFLDQRADEGFYTLDRNPKGTVSIKIVRDKTGEITGVEKMTPAEAQALFSDE